MAFNFPSQLQDIRTFVLNAARLEATADSDKVNAFINQAYADVANNTKYWEGSAATSALVAGATSDAMPTSLIELEDVTCSYAGINPPLIQIQWEALLQKRRMSTGGGSGPPQFYSLRKRQLEFWPAAQGGEVLTYYGSTMPPSWLTNDTDVPDFPEPHATDCLMYGALVKCAEFKNDLLMLGNYQQQFGQKLAKFQAFCNARLGTGSLAFPIYPGDPGTVPHDPSSDWWVYAGIPWN